MTSSGIEEATFDDGILVGATEAAASEAHIAAMLVLLMAGIRKKLEGRGFDSRLDYWIFQLT
jgi:hypothetical protein